MSGADQHEGYASALAQRRNQSLTGIAVATIEHMILTGLIKSGERLNEQALATQLGISRAPIREATRTLERAGLLTAAAFQGTSVRAIAEREAAEIEDVLAAVFRVLCCCAAERLTDEQARAIEVVMERMREAAQAGEVGAYARCEVEFQMLVCECARHDCAAQIFAKVVKERILKRAQDPLELAKMRLLHAAQQAAAAAILDRDTVQAGRCAEAAILGRTYGLFGLAGESALKP
jgi:DNA-binding GntR family transcriptional regulator